MMAFIIYAEKNEHLCCVFSEAALINFPSLPKCLSTLLNFRQILCAKRADKKMFSSGNINAWGVSEYWNQAGGGYSECFVLGTGGGKRAGK